MAMILSIKEASECVPDRLDLLVVLALLVKCDEAGLNYFLL